MTAGRDIGSEISGLRDTVAALEQGLRQMLEIQETHTVMLQQLLLASASPAGEENLLNDLVGQLIEALKRQHSMLGSLKVSIDQLPKEVGSAVSSGVRDVLGHL